MKKHLLLLFAALLPLVASAEKVEIDGIWYNLVSKAKQAEVISNPDGETKYSGSITLPATVTYDGVTYSVTSIGARAFEGCFILTAITIPEGVTWIENDAFSRCTSLTDVYCHAETVPSTELSAFDGSNIGQATLHVPASALDSYRATAPWSEFDNIVALTDEEMGVEQLTMDNARITIYDLHGRRVATPTKDGIYIVDGKKVMVKIGM